MKNRAPGGRRGQEEIQDGLDTRADSSSGPASATHPTTPLPQQRAAICQTIHRELALEYFRRTNSRREVWARLAIGLPPFPRTWRHGCEASDRVA
jgi:hypothetical protein